MIKYKTTRSEIEQSGKKVCSLGYCHGQELLTGIEPTSYNKGVYGWNYDVYEFPQVIVVTGYRPFGTPIDGITDKFEKAAGQVDWSKREPIREQWLSEISHR